MYAYVNNELLTKAHPSWKEFNDWCRNEWPKLPEFVIFKNGKNIPKDPRHGLPEPVAFQWYQLISSVSTPEGLETWHLNRVYATKNEKTGALKFSDDRWQFDISKTVPKSEQELLFFLINKFQPVLKGEIFIENKEQEAQIETEKTAIKGEVAFLINNKKSFLTEANIRLIAMSWNIADTSRLSIPEVKKLLYDTIERREIKLKDGYSKFLTQVENLDDRNTYLTSLIRESIDKKVITFNQAESRIEWCENLPDNQRIIYTILPNEFNNWFEAFGLFLRMNDKLVFTIESSLGKRKQVKQIQEPSPLENITFTANTAPKKRGFQKGHKPNKKVVEKPVENLV
jgi:hypothetical protein